MSEPTPADVQATFAATLVDEWVRAGVAHAVICPGSRSTPLALALADRSGDLGVHVHHDERSGAFMALGIGLATGRPAVVVTTSGTAAAELHPAVVEADLAAVPLLVCTADRPPELRDVGAPQAIDQVHLYGQSVRWYGDIGVPDASGAGRWRAFAARAALATGGARPGPVHVNLPFREPLVGTPGPLPPARYDGPWTVAVGSRPAPDPSVLAELADLAAGLVGRRGVIVAGAVEVAGGAVHEVADALGWPVIAEPRSPAWMAAPPLVPHPDALLRAGRATERLRPEVVVRIGAPGSSRLVNEWLAASGAHEVVAGAPAWSDPAGTAAVVVEGDPARFVAALGAAASAAGGPDGPAANGRPPGTGWCTAWRSAAAAARRAVAAALAAEPATSEPAVARALVAAVPDGGRLVVSSSMPIRDVERYAEARPAAALTVHANRGANGIDGVVSTAVGVAAASGVPTALLIGDVAFLHDSNGLLGAADRRVDLVCVVVDNDGGGIFSFLPQARTLAADRFEALFGTPHGVDLVALASAHGADARRLGPSDDVGRALAAAAGAGGVHVLVVPGDRAANVEVHDRVDRAVAAAVDEALAGP